MNCHEMESEGSQKRECKYLECLEIMAVQNSVKTEAGTDHILTYSSISGDATAYDQQFNRLKHFIRDAVEPYHSELRTVLYPMFVHIYIELLCNGHKTPGHKFYARHKELFSDDDLHGQFLDSLVKLYSHDDIQASKDTLDFRDHKYEVSLSKDAVHYLMRHLKIEDNMIILQVFNQHIKVAVQAKKPTLDLNEDHNGNTTATTTSTSPTTASTSPTTTSATMTTTMTTEKGEATMCISPKTVQEEVSLSVLEQCIKRVREGAPCLPSICFYAFLNTYQGLCCSTISPGDTMLSGGFEDSSIKLWSLIPKLLTSAPSMSDTSRPTLGTEYSEPENMTHASVTEKETATLRSHNGSVYKTCFTPDSKYLLSCSEDTTVRLWDLKTHTNVVCYRGHSYPVWDIDVSPMGGNFVSCSHDCTAKLWSTDRLFPLRTFVGHLFDVDCVKFHPNSNYVATGSSDKTVRLWSVQEGKSVRLMQGHRSSILALAFSPGGQYLASAGEDRRIRVWDLGTGSLYKELRGHTDTVYALSFSSDGSLLTSGGLDCCIRIWDTRKSVASTGSITDGHTSSELVGAYPTKSATVNFLRYANYNMLQAAGAV